jgi:tryptophanyl-tRNA synthetase
MMPIINRFLPYFRFSTSKHPPILLTGLQPTGHLHLGNYFGSVHNVLKYQQDPTFSKRFLFIADLHSLTTAFTAEHDMIVYNGRIGKDSFEMVKTLLACGVDVEKTTLFVQSHVPEHSELAWILSCFANQHALNFMVQYKEKANETSSVGLYTYPLLMASDILIYRSTHVPVGVDQVQHL